MPIDVQAGGFRQRNLPGVETEKLGGTEGDSQSDVEKIHASHAKFFRVVGSQGFRCPESINPWNCNVLKNSASQVRFNVVEGLLALIWRDFASKHPQADGVPHFKPVQRSEWKRLTGGLQPRQHAHGFRLGRVGRHQKTGIGVNSHGMKHRLLAGGLIRSRLAVFDNDVRGKDSVAIDAPEPGRKIRALWHPAAPRPRWRRKKRYNFAALADADGFAFFNPIYDAAKIMAQLPDCRCFHGRQ
jgi:hypothetical protein